MSKEIKYELIPEIIINGPVTAQYDEQSILNKKIMATPTDDGFDLLIFAGDTYICHLTIEQYMKLNVIIRPFWKKIIISDVITDVNNMKDVKSNMYYESVGKFVWGNEKVFVYENDECLLVGHEKRQPSKVKKISIDNFN